MSPWLVPVPKDPTSWKDPDELVQNNQIDPSPYREKRLYDRLNRFYGVVLNGPALFL